MAEEELEKRVKDLEWDLGMQACEDEELSNRIQALEGRIERLEALLHLHDIRLAKHAGRLEVLEGQMKLIMEGQNGLLTKLETLDALQSAALRRLENDELNRMAQAHLNGEES